MPDMYPYIDWLQRTRLSISMHDAQWLFPMIEIVHLFGIVALLGTTLALDLRLMDLWLRPWPVSRLMKGLLLWTWASFVVMVCTGSGMFVSNPMRFFYNTSFRLKMILILLAGLNALLFQVTTFRSLNKWDLNARTPVGAKIAGFCSMILWFGVAAAGRWIAWV